MRNRCTSGAPSEFGEGLLGVDEQRRRRVVRAEGGEPRLAIHLNGVIDRRSASEEPPLVWRDRPRATALTSVRLQTAARHFAFVLFRPRGRMPLAMRLTARPCVSSMCFGTQASNIWL